MVMLCLIAIGLISTVQCAQQSSLARGDVEVLMMEKNNGNCDVTLTLTTQETLQKDYRIFVRFSSSVTIQNKVSDS